MNSAVALATVVDGPESIVVCGAVVSMLQVRDAGLGSGLPAVSTERTSNVRDPSARPE